MPENEGTLLRSIARDAVRRLADWDRHPEIIPYDEIRPLIALAGGEHAQKINNLFLIKEFRKLGPNPSREACEQLLLRDKFFRALPELMAQAPSTEIGAYARLTDPDYRQVHYAWDRYQERAAKVLEASGNRITMIGNMGAGKTHLSMLFAEVALGAGMTVMVNMGLVQDRSGEHQGRIHHAASLSQIIKTWAQAPASMRFFVVIDEPESVLQAGFNTATRNWQTFQHFLRKADITLLEIWHDEQDMYRGVRDGDGPRFFRIVKREREMFSIQNEGRVTYVHDLPKLGFLEFQSKSMGSITVDVDMAAFMTRLSNVPEAEMKQAALVALADPAVYVKTGEPKVVSKRRRQSDALARVLAHPEEYRNQHGRVSENIVQAKHGLTVRAAKAVAQQANQDPGVLARLKQGRLPGQD